MVESKQLWMVKIMNIVICDDDINFANIVKNYISEYAALHDITNQIHLCSSAEQLLRMNLTACDVLFLDIHMNGLNGIDAAKKLRERYPELLLVFLTGWIEYAPAGYRVNAFRYLLKKDMPEGLWTILDEIQEKLFETAETLLVHCNSRDIKVPLKNIAYFEGTRQNHVWLHYIVEIPKILCSASLSGLEQELTCKGFLRIQRSFLVNMVHIEMIRNYTVFLRNGAALKASERQYSNINRQYLMWRGRIL